MQCSGLRENMDLEEAILVICSTERLWKCIFTVKGTKKDKLLNETLLVKARNTVLQLKEAVENRTISIKLFKNIQEKRELCQELFTLVQESPCEKVKRKWLQIADEIQKKMENMKIAMHVFHLASQKIKLGLPKTDSFRFCLNMLKEQYQTLTEGKISIKDSNSLIMNCDKILETILKDCRILSEVVTSDVFWNIAVDFVAVFDVETNEEEDQDDEFFGIASLFQIEAENDQTVEGLQNGCKYLQYLSGTVFKEYEQFWFPLLSGKDVLVSTLQKYLGNAEILQEMLIAEKICSRTADKNVHMNLKIYSEFEQQSEIVDLMKMVLKAFKVDVLQDANFQKALSEFERLLYGEIGDMTLSYIGSSLKVVGDVVNVVESNMIAVLKELQKASVLIEFLQTVVDEDIRNLIDAVEEHSEQFVRESTVSDLIEVKRFLQPILKQKYVCIRKFFQTLKKSLETSGIKNIDHKVYECCSNLHSLKALYNHVANRGEHTKETIENIVKRGVFHFVLKEKSCDVTVECKQDKKTHLYSKSYLNDLRSRALLILNTEEKQAKKSQPKEHLAPFIELIDSAEGISQMCVLLKKAGHFHFVHFDQRKRKEMLQDLLNELKSKYDDWCNVLYVCRKRFYLMNYIQSDQLQVLYEFIKNGQSKDSIITILKFINPAVSDVENILGVLQQKIDLENPEVSLEALGKAFDGIGQRLVPVPEKMFDKEPKSKLSDIVQPGRLYVAALEADSQLVIKTLLALHWNTTKNIPFAHNVLFCNRNTSQDEITLLLNRCLGCKTDHLFSIANVEMLNHETQDYIIKSLRKFQEVPAFKLSMLCKGNRNHYFLEKMGHLVMQPKPLTENELQQFLNQKYPHVLTVTSENPGLGKSEEIQRHALKTEKGKITLHISGIFDRENIVEELLRMKIRSYHVLHIDIGPVNDPQELDTFLFELIVLKHVSAGKFAFYLKTEHICVEIANTVNNELQNSLPTVTCFRRKNIVWNNYNNMIVSREVNSPIQVVCHYLQLQDSGLLDQTDVYLTGDRKVCPLPTEVCRELLQKHFSTSSDMSFTVVNIFLGVFADQLKKLSSSVFFRCFNNQHQSVKCELVNALQNMSIDFSSRSINACRSAQIASMSAVDSFKQKKMDDPWSCSSEVMVKRTDGMIRWEDGNHLMVLFHLDLQTVSALYRRKEKVPKQILNLFESQLKKELDDFSKKSQDELQSILLKLVQPSGFSVPALNEMTKRYALTPDNLLKMVLIILRIQGHQPIVIMGETGCGKTSLIRFLSVLSHVDFQVLSIHAGVTEEVIVSKVSECDRKAKENLKTIIWLFLDEINTCDHLGLICDILCHHYCKGKMLSTNLKVLAACNPYRLRSDKSILTTGLQGKIKTDHLSKLVYRVYPLPETMIEYVWDYGSLQKKDEEAYIIRMMQGLFKFPKLVELFVDLLIISQQFVQEEEGTDCCVSLRDVERCRRLVEWFICILKTKNKSYNYQLYNLETSAMILALSICYHSRFPNNNVRKRYREKVAHCCAKCPDLHIKDEKAIKNIIVEQQNDILDRMELPPGTAKNTALRENVFVILVCILNRIPVFVVGKPGCSKSLSMQLIRSNLRGKDSSDAFFRSLPQLYCVSFQGSESSTSDGIMKVFEKAKNYQSHSQSEDVLSVVILDEIGLAEISRFNPLKVLHNLLEPENQAIPDIAVVGISNWALDAAKMNRAIHLSRPEMDEKELFETALSISESLLRQPSTPAAVHKFSLKKNACANTVTEEVEQLLKNLADAFSKYSKKQKYKNFHGLRDFYSLTKYISKGILVDKQTEQIDNVINRGLLRNLGGLSNEIRNTMLLEFQNCLQINNENDAGVLDLIRENLLDQQSRHLMLITNGDAVLSVLEDTVKEMNRQHLVIFGSRFEDDLTDDYNYRILSRIILCMEQGYVLILKDLENIYGSLYDMLNQNYTTVGSKKNCRVALGPYSNPMCHVHEEFKCIVLVEESKLDFSDPPFLNRFEKQQFRFEDMMDVNAINIRNQLIKFTAEFCKIIGYSYRPENVFPMSGENCISSLVLKILKEEKRDEQLIIQKCQNNLLWITPPEAMLRIKDSVLGKTKHNSVSKLEKLYYSLPIHNGLLKMLHQFKLCNDNEHKTLADVDNETSLVFVFTYDSEDQPLSNQSFQVKTERLRNFTSEKHLNQTMKAFFNSDLSQFILHCSVSEDFEHVLLAKATIENCLKNAEKTSLEPKNVCIICHLDRQEYKREPVTQINFLSGWKLAFLDVLLEPKIPLPKVINLSVDEILESRRPMKNTVSDFVFWSYTTIQYVGTGHTADRMMNTVRRIKESADCLEVLEELIFSSIHGKQYKTFEDWQKKVAYDEHALFRASSYMDTLEQYLLGLIKTPLSKIIFKLEEANALESIFIYTDEKRRFEVWKQLIVKDSLMDIASIPDPSGPECYTCSTGRFLMILPFSFIVLCRVEKIKDDFLNTLRQLKISCDFAEDDELPKTILIGLVEKYSEIIEQDITEYIDLEYDQKFTDYQHDFYLMMTAHKKGILHDEEKVQVMKLTQSLFDIDVPDNDFGLQVSHLHVMHWIYSRVFESVVKIMDVVKEYTDFPIESFFHYDKHSEKCVFTSDSLIASERRDLLVDDLCKIFLPTTSLMTQFSSVQEWQYQVSRVLPCFAEISLNPSSIHMLRFCNDVAHALFSSEQHAAVKVLAAFGDELKNGTLLESSEMFQLVTRQVKVTKENEMIDDENLQHLCCQYLSRSIAIEPEFNSTVNCFLKTTNSHDNLEFFGPILELVLDIEIESESYSDLIEMDLNMTREDSYFRCISDCLRNSTDGGDSILSSLLVMTIQDAYRAKVTPESLGCIEESSSEFCRLSFRASDVLRKQTECSFSIVASIGYLRSFLNGYIEMIRQTKKPADKFPVITQTINAFMEVGDEANLSGNIRIQCLQVYFLKCLFSVLDIHELKKYLSDFNNCFPILKSLDWKDDFICRSLTFHPLHLYSVEDDKNFEMDFVHIEIKDKNWQKNIVEIALSSSQEMFSFIGYLVSTFYLQSQQTEMSDTKKYISRNMYEMIKSNTSTKKCRVLELVLKITDFDHPLFQLDTQTKAPDIQIVSILTHLLSLIIFNGEIGNMWYDILTDASNFKSRYLPGKGFCESIQRFDKNKIHLCEPCKTRFFRSVGKCPRCGEVCKSDKLAQKEKKKSRKPGYEKPSEELIVSGFLSPFTHHLLQFIIHGCILLSVAAKFENSDNLQSLLCLKEDLNEVLPNILFLKWRYLKSLSQLNNEDLCALLHVLIYGMKDVFTVGDAPFHCKKTEDCDKVEQIFQINVENALKDKYICVGKARLSLYKRLGVDPSSLECQIHEVCEIEGSEEKQLMLPRLFRMTSPATKKGLVAQVFLDKNRKKFPFLSLVLMTENILVLPKFILPILRWHHSTVSIGSYKMKKVDCKEETIEKFFRMENDAKRRRLLRNRFDEFKTAWNDLLRNHVHLLKVSVNEEHALSYNSKVIKCIITEEHSLIQKVMLELVKIHNNIIDECLFLASTSDVPSLRFLLTGKQLSEVKSTSLWELSSNDIIKFSSWSDELLRYSQCKSNHGEGKDRFYNLLKIESELAHRLILGKPYISVPQTFPRILFIDELFQNTVQLLENIRNIIPQEKLPQVILKSIERKKENDNSKITELMTVLGMALSLLKKTNGEPSLPLLEYIQVWKELAVFPISFKSLFPEPHDAVKLCHVVNLYVKLEELNGETIHETLDETYKDDLPPEGKEKLETTGESYVDHLVVLAASLKIFVHRCLAVPENTVSVDQVLIDYIEDEEFWPQGNLKDGVLYVGGKTKNLSEILCSCICVKHIYNLINFIQDFIQVMLSLG